MKKLTLIAAIFATTLAFGQCKEVTIASNMTEFYKIDIKGDVLYLTYNQAGIKSLLVSKDESLRLDLEEGNSIYLLARQIEKTYFVSAGDLSRSEIVPTYIITAEQLKTLSSFGLTNISFKGINKEVKNKRRKGKLMSLAACNINN